MQCPVCDNQQLAMTERQGIEIDYCPTCRGVWLDRGELDKIIERGSAELGGPESREGDESATMQQRGQHGDSKHSGRGKKRRSGFLGEMFDF